MSASWIRISGNGQSNMRIFCFPYSGGTGQVFGPLAGMVPEGVGVYALELPGRGRRFCEDLPQDVGAMVQEAQTGLDELLHIRSAVFFGHSLGGLIAYELAHLLGDAVQHLFVSGVRAPQVPRREEIVHDLPQAAFVAKIAAMGGTPREILANEEMLEIVLPILRSDFRAYETYRYVPHGRLACPITAIGGRDDDFVTEDDICLWGQHTAGNFAHHMLPGGHFIIHTHLREMADIIVETLRRTC